MGWGTGNLSGGMIGVRVKIGTEQPTTTAENVIWVKTDKIVPEWVISSTPPIAPKQWMVWIENGLPSMASFNALRRNQLMISIARVMIFDGSIWKNISASIYQDGVWKTVSNPWNGELYISGDEFIEKTGGWVSQNLKYDAEPGPTGTNTLAKNDSQMIFNVEPTGAVLYAKNKIDLTGYSRLIFNGRFDNITDPWQYFTVWSNFGSNAMEYVAKRARPDTTGIGQVTIDISDLNGYFIIGFAVYVGTITVDKVYME